MKRKKKRRKKRIAGREKTPSLKKAPHNCQARKHMKIKNPELRERADLIRSAGNREGQPGGEGGNGVLQITREARKKGEEGEKGLEEGEEL